MVPPTKAKSCNHCSKPKGQTTFLEGGMMVL